MDPGWIEAIATLVASGVAAWGINSWRTEKRGNLEHDTALRAVKASIGLQSGMTYLLAAIHDSKGNSHPDTQLKIGLGITELKGALNEFEASCVEVQATWDDEEHTKVFAEFLTYARHIQYLANCFVSELGGDGPILNHDGEPLTGWQNDMLCGDDASLRRVSDHVKWFRSRIDAWARPYLRRDATQPLLQQIFAAADPPPKVLPAPERSLQEQIDDLIARADRG
jgi:hypothetical protein